MSDTPAPPPSFPRRFAFWFPFAFFLLCTYTIFAEPIPGLAAAAYFLNGLQQSAIVWLAETAFGIEFPAMPGGSGDTSYNWFEVAVFVAVAALAAAAIAALDRRPGTRAKRRYFVEGYLRFALAAAMLLYGFAKVFPSQFAPVTLDRLMTPYGDSSPMGLLWMLMRVSRPYQVFGGMAEVVAGLLLLSRRTTTLGALVTAAVMANVVAMNLFYDVPVKLFATQLFLIACVVAAPEAWRLFRFLVLRREASLSPLPEPFPSPRGRKARIGLELALGATMVATSFAATAFEDEAEMAAFMPPKDIVGTYAVEPVTAADPAAPRWLRVTIGEMGTASLMTDDLRAQWMRVRVEDGGTTISLALPDTKPPRTFLLRREGDALAIAETKAEAPFEVRLRRLPTPEFLLTSRGFHLVNETSFHR